MPSHPNNSCHASNAAPDNKSNHYPAQVTKVPGRCIHPSKLGNMLKARFGDHYSVEMRADTYHITAGSKITYADIRTCY
ncbi:hypothetical protein GGS24DRAFT_484442 [Hypoxylon argillaceum]|nr:hypothetical protein GGS24DRAFT_484442 [Hypoxylon argillaceum]